MKKLYIHAGFDKCGSSSIQTFLSRQGEFKCKNGDDLVYAAFLRERIGHGKELAKLASHNVYGFRDSLPLKAFKTSPEEHINAVGGQLLSLLQKSHVVLSRESWNYEFDAWNKISFFSKNKIDVTLIFYIRPPVTWMNSAWWQWGAWSGIGLDAWIDQVINAVNYVERIRAFSSLSWVKGIHVRLLDTNLLDDFSNLVGLDREAGRPLQSVANKSLSNGILRLFQAHRRLRPDPHNSGIDFVLEKHLKLEGKADWILDSANIKKIIGQTRNSNLALMDFIDEDCKAKFLADQRYWDPAAFDGLPAKPATGVKPTYGELEGIALAGIDAVMDLAAQQAKMKANAHPLFDQFTVWRDLALYIEDSDIELAYRLMQQAAKLRPEGEFIQRKLARYKMRLDKLKKKTEC
ncbi:MAG: hypothetical protein Q8N96_03865 [Methylovulum sp.]|nr:hypothetical protein [Methylovulum sp.]